MSDKNVFKKEEDEMISLNGQLYDEFHIQELESRLETDPLMAGGLMDFFNAQNPVAQALS